jgi:adhesin/invasin
LIRRPSWQGRGWPFVAICAAAALYVGCKDSPTEPSQTAVPTTMSALSSTSITGTIGQPVAEPPAVVIRDQLGDPMFGVAVTFTVEAGGGTVTGATVFSDAQGMAAVGSWTLGTTAGAQTLVANAGTLGPVTFTAAAQPGQAVALSKTAGDDQTAPVGTPVPVAPAVTALDQFGNPVPGVPVSFAVASGGGSVTVGAAVTNAQGTVTVGNWTLGTTPGPNTLTATADTMSVTFTATATAGAAANMVVHAGAGQTATVATAVPVAPAVRITDAFDNPVPGVAVTFAVTAGGGSVTDAAAVTDADGVATVGSWTLGTTAGANTLTATAGALTVDFQATGTTGPAANIARHAGDEQEAIVGTAVAVNPSVRVTDAHGNAVAGAAVTFAVESGGGSVTGASQTTDANGVATVGSWTLGPTAGPNALTATAGALSTTFTATGTPAPAANIAKHAGDVQSATVATPVAIAPAVRVTDLHGNPVEGLTVTFAVTGGGGSVTGASQATDADGVATVGSWTLGTIAGANTLQASVNGLSTTFTATGTAGAPATITKHAGDGQTAAVATTVAVPPAVRITDSHGNAVSGVAVTFAVASGGGSVADAAQVTDGDGVATVGSWTLGPTAGANLLDATAGALETTFSATGVAGPPANMVIVSGDAQTATVGTAVPIAPTVKVTDAFANEVAGVTVTFVVTLGGGSVTDAAPVTGADGNASVGSWTLGNAAGPNALTASAGGLNVTFVATGSPGPAAIIAVVAGDGQSAEVNTAVAVAPSVQVTDAFGNPSRASP